MGLFGWDLPPGCRVSDLPGYSDEPIFAVVDGCEYVWLENDSVLKYSGEHATDYDDGFREIGKLAWTDPDDPEAVLRDWVRSQSKT
jgi:hypothetical protein